MTWVPLETAGSGPEEERENDTRGNQSPGRVLAVPLSFPPEPHLPPPEPHPHSFRVRSNARSIKSLPVLMDCLLLSFVDQTEKRKKERILLNKNNS